ncbi:GNAT family N-acetyltransferase [Pleionea sp. CnH1-48]|nr:GNAT family N-acetyltransferase [Pleionea sp. CnH1-48]
MTQLSIQLSTNDSELQQIEALAEIIWHEHYTPIIGTEQVLYMLDKFQSFNAMKQQIEQDGYQYYSMFEDSKLVGYFAIQSRGSRCFLSKLYVDKQCRGRGFSRQALIFIDEQAKATGCSHISLTVNKYNSGSIAAYKKMGFEQIDEVVADIGSGYVMDDYVLEKTL